MTSNEKAFRRYIESIREKLNGNLQITERDYSLLTISPNYYGHLFDHPDELDPF